MSLVVLNFQIEISDEVIKAFNHALGGRNQQKSPEAKEVYERLCLLNLDKRLKVLESSAADGKKVERALNNVYKRIADIESNVETMIGRVYDFVENDKASLNGKIEKLEKNFKTELNSEVAKAVGNFQPSNFSPMIQAEVAKAIGNLQPSNFSPMIQAEVAKAVGNLQPPNFSSMIQAEVAKAIGNLQPSNFSSMIQAEVAKAIGNLQPPNFSPMIQAEVAKAVKEECQKTPVGNAIYPSSYLAFEQQRSTINGLKKVIEELTARLSAVEGKTTTATVEPAKEEYMPLNIRDESSWLKYNSRLKDIGKLKLFAEKNPVEFKIFASRLKRIETAIDKIKPNEFDEYTTGTIADKTVELVKEFIDVLDTCRRKIGNPLKNTVAAKELYNLIEEYLSGLGIRSMNFKVGDDYNEWADLAMSETPIIESTSDRRKHNVLKEIYVQPHYIEFINEHDKKVRRVFGGRCVAYAYKDKGDDYGRPERLFSRN